MVEYCSIFPSLSQIVFLKKLKNKLAQETKKKNWQKKMINHFEYFIFNLQSSKLINYWVDMLKLAPLFYFVI
jgi:hypothetical protein